MLLSGFGCNNKDTLANVVSTVYLSLWIFENLINEWRAVDVIVI